MRNLGLTARQKLGMQIVVALIIGFALLGSAFSRDVLDRDEHPIHEELPPGHVDHELRRTIPGPTRWPLSSSIGFMTFVLVGSSNAVNLTDGLDGLAIGLMIIASGAMTILSYVSGHARFAEYLEIARLPGAGELTIFCGSMVGASLGFLWYNAHPAEVFMGDVGSLALGGSMGTVAILIKQEVLLVFIGGVYVIEALSVILQVGSFKLRGKRIFKMSPLHHHFEAHRLGRVQDHHSVLDRGSGMALFALTTLKLR